MSNIIYLFIYLCLQFSVPPLQILHRPQLTNIVHTTVYSKLQVPFPSLITQFGVWLNFCVILIWKIRW